MKRNLKIRIGMCLVAIAISTFHTHAEELPAAIVVAEGKKPADMTGCAIYRYDCGIIPPHYSAPRQQEVKHFYLQLRTNTLYDLALLPNIGMEAGLGKGWSIGGNVLYGWWTDRSRFFWRAFSADIGVRKYFGGGQRSRSIGNASGLSGHHVGLYAGIVTYDFELGSRGIICDWRDEWGRFAGLEYGYSLPVAKNLNIDFSVGIGYAGGKYKEYLPVPNAIPEELHYVWQSTGKMHYFGPTRLEISLVWTLDLTRKIK